MLCPKCGLSLPEDSEFCQYCGSKLTATAVPAENSVPAKSPELAGKTCPFCKAPFMEGEAVVFCSHCEMPHHLDCWKENGGCTTFGCTGNIGKIIGAEQKNAQSAPVAIRTPPAPEPPKNIPHPQTRGIPETKHTAARPQPAAVPARVVPQEVTILNENNEKILQGSLPVLLEKTVLRKESDGKLSVVCCFRSLADKVISAMLVDVECADIWRESVRPVEGHQYLDLKVARDELFGESVAIPLPDFNTRVVEVLIQKIMFTDGMLLVREGENVKIPEPVPLSKTLGEELLEEYRCQTYRNANYLPVQAGSLWRCTCGALNHEKESACHLCGDRLESLLKRLDKAALQQSVDEKKRIQREKEERERIAREEALRLQREKEERERRERAERERIRREKAAAEAAERARIAKERAEKAAAEERERAALRKARNKKIAVISAIAAAVVAAVYLVGWQIIPANRYKNAETALAAGDYDSAYDGFSSVGSYRDGKERASAVKYEEGERAFEAGDYDTAYSCFTQISGYSDSETMAKEVQYQKGTQALKSGDYDTAYACFSELDEYSDSETMAKETLYQKAEKLEEEGAYSEAEEIFLQIKSYKNSYARSKTCKGMQIYLAALTLYENKQYREAAEQFESAKVQDSKEYAQKAYYYYATELIEQGKLHEAYEVLNVKVNNSGKTSYEDSVELANSVEYQYAADRMAAGDYETAYASFGSIIEYKDSKNLWQETGYQYATQLFENKDYNQSAAVFTDLGTYKNSAKQANESNYQYGLSLLSQKKYAEAEKVFTDLGSYSDSGTQIKETKYQHALSLQKDKKYKDAEKLFAELKSYKDSATQLKETKYLNAASLEKSGKLKQAVPIYKELGNFKDSADKWKSLMWSYVQKNKNNNDKTTYEYLTELKKTNYKDSKKYYEDLYSWKVTGYITTSSNGKHLSSVSTYQKQVNITFRFSGGAPEESIKVKITYTWPNGYSSTHKNTLTAIDGSEYTISWRDYLWSDLRYASKGNFTLKFYNSKTGSLIGSLVFKLT